jgi:hypothetical protein
MPHIHPSVLRVIRMEDQDSTSNMVLTLRKNTELGCPSPGSAGIGDKLLSSVG